jgi:hypothetical protein
MCGDDEPYLIVSDIGRGADGSSATIIDEIGTGLGCTTMDSKAKDIIVVRDEAIYLCRIDGRGALLCV